MPTASTLLLPRGYRVRSVSTDGAATLVNAVTTRRSARCPLCRRRSRHVHSGYWRTLLDLPAHGHMVSVRVRARRFFCRAKSCSRGIFAERLADLADPYARRTDRLKGELQHVGFVLGGRPGARLAQQMQMPTSRSTLLRVVDAAPLPEAATPRALGVDDWAFRRGHRYGTILVDLESHRPVDLLAERTAEALAGWLREHPGVEVIARDRSGSYAEGASQGAQDAVQVADRWHLLKNLVDALERFLNGQAAALQAAAREEPPEAEVVSAAPALRHPPDAREHERLNRRAPRLARYERTRTLAEEGHSFREIARQTGMARATVIRYIRAGEFPEIAQRVKTPSRLDPYCAYIEQRWQAGCRNGRQLYAEIRSQGYGGSYARLCAWLSPWRNRHAETPEQRARPRRSSRRVAHWLIRKADDLEKEDQQFLERLQAGSVDCAVAQTLAREFATMVRERQGERLLGWIERAKVSGVAAIRRFAEGLVPDLAAVTAGLALPWSNGPTEGAVNRLKLIKRQMYGRAGFNLLRRRVLYNAW